MHPTADPIPRAVAEAIARHDLIPPGATVVVAVSGGPDSLALLDVLRRLALGPLLHVATLDHGLRGAVGAADAAFVRETAAGWDLPVTVGRADVPALAESGGLSTEEAARQVRYAFLLRVARAVGAPVIATGHHRDDQAETVLMHLVRGAGLDGLRGMRPRVSLRGFTLPDDPPLAFDPPLPEPLAAPGSWPDLVRPLLGVARAAIEDYLAARGLRPRHDASNEDLACFRNRLRHRVIPLLEQLNPNLRATLARTAEVLRGEAELAESAGVAALARVLRQKRPGSVILDRAAWDDLTEAERRTVLRAVIRRLRPGLHNLGFDHVRRALRILDAPRNKHAAVTLPSGLVLREGHGVLTIGPVGAAVLEWEPGRDAPALPTGTVIGPFAAAKRFERTLDAWTFSARPLAPADELAALHADPLAAALAIPAGARLELRTRRPGDRFRPRGLGGHSQKLGDTFNAMRVPVAWRDRVPLLVVADAIAWFVAPGAGGLRGRVAAPFALSADRATGHAVRVFGWREGDLGET